MKQGSTVFAQVMDFLPKRQFRRCVGRYHGDFRVRSFKCFDKFLCMAFTFGINKVIDKVDVIMHP